MWKERHTSNLKVRTPRLDYKGEGAPGGQEAKGKATQASSIHTEGCPLWSEAPWSPSNFLVHAAGRSQRPAQCGRQAEVEEAQLTSRRKKQCTAVMTKPCAELKTAKRAWKRTERRSVMARTADIHVSARRGSTTQELQSEALREQWHRVCQGDTPQVAGAQASIQLWDS